MSLHSVRSLLFGTIAAVLLSLTLYGCEKSVSNDQKTSGDLAVRIGALSSLERSPGAPGQGQ